MADPYGITSPVNKIPSQRGVFPQLPRKPSISPGRVSLRLPANGFTKMGARKSVLGGPPAGYVLPADARIQDVVSTGPIQGQSQIEYVPYERKYIDYESREQVDRVPVQKTVIDYQEVKKIDYVPKEKRVTDYYAIEHQITYVPQSIPETKIEYVPVEVTTERIEYVPVQRQVVHYPDDYGMSTRRPTGVGPNFPGLQGLQNGAVISGIQHRRSASVLLNDLRRPSSLSIQKLPNNSILVANNSNTNFAQLSKLNPKSLASTGSEFHTFSKVPSNIKPNIAYKQNQLKRPHTEYVQSPFDENDPVKSSIDNQLNAINRIHNSIESKLMEFNKTNGNSPTDKMEHKQNTVNTAKFANYGNTNTVYTSSVERNSIRSSTKQTGMTKTIYKQIPQNQQYFKKTEFAPVRQSLNEYIDGSNKSLFKTTPLAQSVDRKSQLSTNSKSGIRMTVNASPSPRRPISLGHKRKTSGQ